MGIIFPFSKQHRNTHRWMEFQGSQRVMDLSHAHIHLSSTMVLHGSTKRIHSRDDGSLRYNIYMTLLKDLSPSGICCTCYEIHSFEIILNEYRCWNSSCIFEKVLLCLQHQITEWGFISLCWAVTPMRSEDLFVIPRTQNDSWPWQVVDTL